MHPGRGRWPGGNGTFRSQPLPSHPEDVTSPTERWRSTFTVDGDSNDGSGLENGDRKNSDGGDAGELGLSLRRLTRGITHMLRPRGHMPAYQFDDKVEHDMSAPLSHYFISSGHNSYLTADQLVGDSGTATIVRSLKGGCRMIELDVYNGGLEGPICKHGGTATKPVLFRDCIVAIRKHAFEMSPYPVIITLENHTDAENQKPLVKTLIDELGDSLYRPPPGPPTTWESPETLRHKFLIRTKLKRATEALAALVYIPITKFRGFAEMNALEYSTSSSMGESKVEVMLKVLARGGSQRGSRLNAFVSLSSNNASERKLTNSPSIERTSLVRPSPADPMPALTPTSPQPSPQLSPHPSPHSLGLHGTQQVQATCTSHHSPPHASARQQVQATCASQHSSPPSPQPTFDSWDHQQQHQRQQQQQAAKVHPLSEGSPVKSAASQLGQGQEHFQPGQPQEPFVSPFAAAAAAAEAVSAGSPGPASALGPATSSPLTSPLNLVLEPTLALTGSSPSRLTSGTTQLPRQLSPSLSGKVDCADAPQDAPSTAPEPSVSRLQQQLPRLCSVLERLSCDKPPADQLLRTPSSVTGTGSDALLGTSFDSRAAYAYTSRHLLRVYPASWRMDSRNFDPTLAWSIGASCVALNWQHWDRAMWVNQGKFRDNGGCGYVKKPQWLLDAATQGLPQRAPSTLLLHVIEASVKPKAGRMAWMPHCSTESLSIHVKVRGMPEDASKQVTSPIKSTATLRFDKAFEVQVVWWEVAVLLIILKQDKQTLGYFSAPLATLKSGRYKIGLNHPNGDPMDQCWVKVQFAWKASDSRPQCEQTDCSSLLAHISSVGSWPTLSAEPPPPAEHSLRLQPTEC